MSLDGKIKIEAHNYIDRQAENTLLNPTKHTNL